MKKRLILAFVLLINWFNFLFAQELTLDGGNCSATILYNNQPISLVVNVGSNAQDLYFRLQSQTDCLILNAISNGDSNWLTLPTNIGYDFTISVQENSTPNSRFDIINIIDRQDNTIAVFKLQQSGNPEYVAYYSDSDGDGFGDFNA
ncbi:hypothetical protein, partial [Tenacibaculum sp. 190524A05c]|uniref:hypothetical protein n=1 Tax=Tenacibaculum platacis TaxID=3137852 RepID=UPI0032B1F626